MAKSKSTSMTRDAASRMHARQDDAEFLVHWKAPALFSYATKGEHLVRQIQDYVRQREVTSELQMVLHGSTLTLVEIESVLNADNRPVAASQLISAKLDRLS